MNYDPLDHTKEGRDMRRRIPRVISSNAIRAFIKAGGSLTYEAYLDDDNAPYWVVFGVDSNGNKIPVFNSVTSGERIIKSADGVLAYHYDYLPDAGEVTIPYPPDSWRRKGNTWKEKQDAKKQGR